MRYTKVVPFLFSFFLLITFASKRIAAQTATTGDLTGVVTDPTGAIIPNVTVQLRNVQQGTKLETKTNDSGVYRFSLLPSGAYEISINASGFQTITVTTTVSIGQVTAQDIKLTLGTSSEKIVVTEPAPLVQTEGGSTSATLNEAQIQTMPNQGNDMTYPLLMTPGVTENTLSGYGNYSVNGMSATSNLFTINGMDNNDPYLSIGNSGATSLMLGESEVQEATIVSNGYGGQFNGLAGSNVNIITRGGTNQFHGSATYYWNGREFNANSFINNANNVPRSFVNANQYAANVGGPIIKDKLFWYFNTEGLRLIVPASPSTQLVPSPEFEAATIVNLQATHPASVPYYNNLFSIYDAARSAHDALPGSNNLKDPTGCGVGTTNPFT
ncbi:MAG TPA: TonB-dependent receptor, partial [Candidatus Acidoferrales bacterium]|nr:TonB-dependent receptor [Candidatus Acidoferrales bacterium]